MWLQRPREKSMKWVNGLLGLLAIAAGWVWLKTPGYLFLLDYVTGPTLQNIHSDTTALLAGIPIQLLAQLLALIIPTDAITKVLIILALSIAGISAAHLAKRIAHSNIIAMSCGMFFMFNPFVFNRIFMGHTYLLFGYALMPLLLLLILKYIATPSRNKAIWIATIATLIVFISIHYIVLLPIVVLFFILQYHKYIPEKIPRKHIFFMLVPPVMLYIGILCTAFHTPTWTGHALGELHGPVFALRPYCSTSTVWDTLTLSANWRSPTITTYPCMVLPGIGIASGVLLASAAFGASSYWIALLYIVSIALAMGVAFIPSWNPMRDSGKFLANAALVQALLIAIAYATLQQKVAKKIFAYVVFACASVITIATIMALQKSIVPSDYPSAWYEWNTIFAQEQKKPTVLFLPWHQYMAFDFTNYVAVANPAPIFFTNATIISGDNIEIMRDGISVESISANPQSKAIEAMLARADDNNFKSDLTTLIQHEKITHIMLAEPEKNSGLARRLSHAHTISLQSENKDLMVWEVVPNPKQ